MTEIHGTCTPEFEAVRTAFAANFDAGNELGASACVTHHGETVVDIWAGDRDLDGNPWERDTIVNVWSTTKTMAATTLLLLGSISVALLLGIITADCAPVLLADRTAGVVGAAHAVNASLYPKLPYDSIKDFTPVGLIASVPMVLVVGPSSPVKSVSELLALARSRPGALTMASAGSGSGNHIVGELFQDATGTHFVHVPYKGSAPAVTDLLGNQIGIMFDNMPSAIQHVRSGKLVPIAVTTAKRSPELPNVPTIAEAGVPGYEATSWFGMFAPAGTPAPVLAKLNAAIVKVLAQPGGVAWYVMDDPLLALARSFPDFVAAEAAGALKTCADAQSLAALIGCATEKIIAMNDPSTLGNDQKDSINGVNAPRAGVRRPLLPPYYAIKVTGALFHTQGGLDIDARCRALRTDGTPFANLLAAGGAAPGWPVADSAGTAGSTSATVTGAEASAKPVASSAARASG